MTEQRNVGIVATLTVAAALAAAPMPAQHPDTLRVGEPDAIGPEPFSLIKGLRELSDGRVLVTDWIEKRLVVMDFERGVTQDVGRTGSGPNEFRLPDRLVALPSDTTLLVDVGNGRLTVISPTLEFVRTISVYAHGEPYAMSPHAADRRGVLHFRLSPFAVGRGGPSDSVPVGRWAEHGDGVTFVGDSALLKAYTPRPSGPKPGLPYVVFAKQDDWAVAPDGWVAVVRSAPFRVEWYGPEGRVVTGPAMPYERVRVTMEDRRRAVRDFLRSSAISGRGEDGGTGLVPAVMQSDEEVARLAREGSFADEFPPFESGAVWAVGANVWVRRAGPARRTPTFDVFDRAGRRVASVVLPPDRRVVGFGTGTLYATVADANDLLTLERYRTPTIPE